MILNMAYYVIMANIRFCNLHNLIDIINNLCKYIFINSKYYLRVYIANLHNCKLLINLLN